MSKRSLVISHMLSHICGDVLSSKDDRGAIVTLSFPTINANQKLLRNSKYVLK